MSDRYLSCSQGDLIKYLKRFAEYKNMSTASILKIIVPIYALHPLQLKKVCKILSTIQESDLQGISFSQKIIAAVNDAESPVRQSFHELFPEQFGGKVKKRHHSC